MPDEKRQKIRARGKEEPFSCVRQAKLVMQPLENDLSQNENFEKTWDILKPL